MLIMFHNVNSYIIYTQLYTYVYICLSIFIFLYILIYIYRGYVTKSRFKEATYPTQLPGDQSQLPYAARLRGLAGKAQKSEAGKVGHQGGQEVVIDVLCYFLCFFVNYIGRCLLYKHAIFCRCVC